MPKIAFFCKIDENIKEKFDIALIKAKKEHGNREDIIEKLFKNFTKNGL